MTYKVKPLEWKWELDHSVGWEDDSVDHPYCWVARGMYEEYQIRQSGDAWQLWRHPDDWCSSLTSEHLTADEAKAAAGEEWERSVRGLVAALTDIEEATDESE